MHVQMRKPYQSSGRMKNPSYYIAPVGQYTHDLPHTVAQYIVWQPHGICRLRATHVSKSSGDKYNTKYSGISN